MWWRRATLRQWGHTALQLLVRCVKTYEEDNNINKRLELKGSWLTCVFSVSVSPSTDSLDLTIKVNQGSDVYLPCTLPPSSEVRANALWFKKTGIGRMPINLEEDTADRISLLYPLDQDQTILMKETVTEDSGTYYCETPDGTRLSTIQIIVEGKSGNFSYTLL